MPDDGDMRRVLLAVLVLLSALTVLPAQAATKSVSGDVLSIDGRAVDVFIGIDLQDSAGHALKADGTASTGGYAITMRINPSLGAEGSATRTGYATTWHATIPANAVKMYVETYPRNSGTYGTTNDVRYGRALRRFSVGGSLSNVHIRLPLQCAKGGNTGSISGASSIGGVRKQIYRVSAFSIGADNNAAKPILGFNIGTTASNGTFTIPSLAPGTKYRVYAAKTSSGPNKSADVVVNSCARTALNFAF